MAEALIAIGIVAAFLAVTFAVKYLCRKYSNGKKDK